MSSLEEKKLLTDILNAIQDIDYHLEYRRVFEEYCNNKTKQRAVERELGIIGEAMNKILKIKPTIKISYARIIVDLRNKVIHSYDSVNNTIIWKVIMKDIPMLKEEATKLLDE